MNLYGPKYFDYLPNSVLVSRQGLVDGRFAAAPVVSGMENYTRPVSAQAAVGRHWKTDTRQVAERLRQESGGTFASKVGVGNNEVVWQFLSNIARLFQ